MDVLKRKVGLEIEDFGGDLNLILEFNRTTSFSATICDASRRLA